MRFILLLKKTHKTPEKEIEKAQSIKNEYFQNKKKGNKQ